MDIEQKLLPPSRAKRAIVSEPFSTVAPSILPLKVWSKPYFVKYSGSGACSDSTEPMSQNSDAKITSTLSAILANDNDKESQSPSPPCDKNRIPSGGDFYYVKSKTVGNTRSIRNEGPNNMDPKKLRRIMSNRVSAQKSRMKKLQHVNEMGRKVKALEDQIALLHSQVALYRNQQEVLKLEQKRLRQCMTIYTNNSIIKDVEIEENKAEVIRLRKLQLQQQMAAQIRTPIWESGMEEMMPYMNSNQGQYGENREEMNRLKQVELKQLAVLCGDERAETNGHDLFNVKHQQKPVELLMQEQMPNQSGPLQKETTMYSNLGLGLSGIEQLFNFKGSQN